MHIPSLGLNCTINPVNISTRRIPEEYSGRVHTAHSKRFNTDFIAAVSFKNQRITFLL